MRLDILAEVNAERQARRAAVLVTTLGDGAQRLVKGNALANDPLHDLLAEQLAMGKSRLVEQDGVQYFVSVLAPPMRLFVIGAVHISQSLAAMARLVDCDVTIIDPRTAFASQERFPGVRMVADWPDAVLDKAVLDRYSAVIALTHDPKIDDLALARALASDCFYIGALGSRKSHANRVGRLLAQGVSEDKIKRIHAPIGLDIGAVSPSEIAVSILGEVILSLRKKPLRTEKSGAV